MRATVRCRVDVLPLTAEKIADLINAVVPEQKSHELQVTRGTDFVSKYSGHSLRFYAFKNKRALASSS